MPSYEFLKSQGVNCLFLVNAFVDIDHKRIKAEIAFIPPKLGVSLTVTHDGKDTFTVDVPIEQRGLKVYARQLKTEYILKQ
jgi:hypothetical protein